VLDAYDQNLISEETALAYCSKKGPVTRGIDNIKKQRGEATTTITNLQMLRAPAPVKKEAPPVPVTLKLK
jgi:hypothetical protein